MMFSYKNLLANKLLLVSFFLQFEICSDPLISFWIKKRPSWDGLKYDYVAFNFMIPEA